MQNIQKDKNFTLLSILFKLHLLSINIIINLAFILEINYERKDKDIIITEIMQKLNQYDGNKIESFQNILEEYYNKEVLIKTPDVNKDCYYYKNKENQNVLEEQSFNTKFNNLDVKELKKFNNKNKN